MLGVFLLTIRELRAKWIVVGLFAIATLIWLVLALALQLDVVDGSLAGARLFGDETAIEQEVVAHSPDSESAEAVPSDTEPADAETSRNPFGASSLLEGMVFGAQAFASGAAYWIGILLALFATGGLVASFQTRGEIDLLLSKPLSRTQLLLGRLGGVWAVSLALIAYMITAVWLVMAIKSGIWSPRFLLAIPVIWAMFVVLYGIVTLVSVTTTSSALSLMVVLAVVFASLILSIPELETQLRPMWRPVVAGLRHALPRFPTVGTQIVPQLATGQAVTHLGALAASLGIGATLYALAFWRFARRDF